MSENHVPRPTSSRWPERSTSRAVRDEGFSLVEVLAAMVVFAIVVAFTLAMLLRITQGTRQNDLRVAAASLANRQIEAIRGTAINDIPDGLQLSSATVGTTVFTIRQNAALVASGSAASLCGSTSDELAYKLVTVRVSWPSMGAVPPIRADTLKAVGTNVLDSTKGTLAVKVSRADASAADGIPVVLSPGGATVTTGADGCAVFSQLAVGTYTVQLNEAGFLGASDTQLETVGSVGVSAGAVAHADLLYDTATQITVAPGGLAGATMPTDVALMMRSSYVTDAVLPGCGPTSACVTGFPGEVRNLFPTQRTFWAGTCHDAKTAASTIVVDLPTPSTVQVPMATATVDVRVGGVSTAGRPLYAVHAPDSTSTPVPACPGGETHTLPSSQVGGVSVLLPHGTWTIATSPDGSGGTMVTLDGSPASVVVAETP